MTIDRFEIYQRAYLDSVRTVMLIDDRFPTMASAIADENRNAEWDRAARLWQGCRDRRWLCDIDNRSTWDEQDTHRIAGSDLIVLDYHLEGSDDDNSVASRELIASLADNDHTNLVVIYTSASDIVKVQMDVIWYLARVPEPTRTSAMNFYGFDDYLDEVLGVASVKTPSEDVVRRYLAGESSWWDSMKSDIRDICRRGQNQAGVAPAWREEKWTQTLLEAAIQHVLRSQHQSPQPGDQRRVRSGKNHHWVSCGNVFVTILQKPTESLDDEVEYVWRHLRGAIREWKPSVLVAAVDFARAQVRQAGLRGAELALPSRELEAGWWYSLLRCRDETERRLTAQGIVSDLMGGLASGITPNVAELIVSGVGDIDLDAEDDQYEEKALAHALRRSELGEHSPTLVADVGATLNNFRSCERHTPSRLACGTVCVDDDGTYFVCVTPACDMVDREPSQEYHWHRTLHPWRPTSMLRLTMKTRNAEAVATAHLSDSLFVLDDQHPDKMIVLSIKPKASTRQLSHEMMFVNVQSDKVDEQKIPCLRASVGPTEGTATGTPNLIPTQLRLVAQLRPPFAEHILSLTGHHLSRVGTDYLSFKVPKASARQN
jgi:hypothetical protein